MRDPQRWFELLSSPEWTTLGLGMLTRSAGMLLICLVGWVLSRVLGRATTLLVDRIGLESLAEQLGAAQLLYKLGFHTGVARLSGRIIALLTLLLTAYVVLEQLHIPGLTQGVGALLGYLPSVLVALAVGCAGFWASQQLKELLAPADVEVSATRRFMARLLQGAGWTLTALIALSELGVEVSLLRSLIALIYGVSVLGAALAFGLSARPALRELLAGHYVRKLLREGDELTLGSLCGVVLRFERLHLVLHPALAAADEELWLPYSEALYMTVELNAAPLPSADDEGVLS